MSKRKKSCSNNLKNQMDMSVQEIQLLNFNESEVEEVHQSQKIDLPAFI